MPTPAIHLALSTFIAAKILSKNKDLNYRSNLKFFICVSLASLAPDLDFIPGLLVGNITQFHREATHSIFYCLVLSFVLYKLFKVNFKLILFIMLSHILLDFFTFDSYSWYETSKTIQFLWPLSTIGIVNNHYYIFNAIYLGKDFQTFMSFNNISILFKESIIFLFTLFFVIIKYPNSYVRRK